MSLSSEPDRNLGRTLAGQYRVDSLLGEGGMGRVYRGLQLSVNRAVAIKLIMGTPPHQAEWAQRFRREAEATARLSHPNTVRLFDFGITSEQELYIVMELLEGVNLAVHLDEHGPLPLNGAVAIGRQIVCALSEAHALGIIHRDLKPENVFLARVRGGETVAKVMDFGVAGLAHPRQTDKLTLTGTVLGTPAYMSPEQAQGRVVDARSDLYSFGVMLFEMLAGRTPYEADTAVSALVAHVTQPPKRLHEVGARVSRQDAVQTLLDALLAKEPSERPASASELLEALDALTERAPQPRAAAPGSATRIPKPVAVTATALATESPNRPSVPEIVASSARSRALLIGLGVVIAASGALALRYAPPTTPVVTAANTSPPTAAKDAELYRVTIATVPSGASVLFDGAELGKTPYLFEFKRESDVQLVKRGYRREVVRVSADSEPNVVVDLARDKSLPEVEPPKPVATAERTRAAISGKPVQPLPSEPPPVLDPATASDNVYAPDQPAVLVPDAPQSAVPTETTQSAAVDPHEQRAIYDGLGSRPDDDPDQPRRHRLRAAAHAIGRFMGRLLGGGGTPNERVRRQELLQQELPYPTFAEAERAYNHREIDRDRYEDVLWALRERRRQRIDAEKFNLARGLITRPEYESRLDSIGAEFRGQ